MTDFRCVTRKDKTGEVVVVAYKKSKRTVSVSGRITLPYLLPNNNLFSIIKEAGRKFLGLFPFLDQRPSKRISSYFIPEYVKKRKTTVTYVEYEYTFVVGDAVDTSSKEIAQTVLDKKELLENDLIEQINDFASEYG